MEEGLKRYYSNNYNYVEQELHKDGSATITLSKRGENKAFRFRVRDLCGENEEVLEHEVIESVPVGNRDFIKKRIAEARGEK